MPPGTAASLPVRKPKAHLSRRDRGERNVAATGEQAVGSVIVWEGDVTRGKELFGILCALCVFVI
jgi:hypothetical protein